MFKLPVGVQSHNLIDDLRILSWEASEILIYYAELLKNPDNSPGIIRSEFEEDPITIADLEVNDLIIKRINENYINVNWKILSEENVKKGSNHFNFNSKWLWILDPLDGTKDFIQGTGNYAMHHALNFDNKPHIGLVLIPEKNELWISNGQEVFCERRDGSKRDIKLSTKKDLKEMTIVTSKNHRNKALEKLIDKINFKERIIMGSIGCKIASIIRGESDIYISLSLPGKSCPKDWDFAAPEAILKASGGAITNLDNQELSYNDPSFNKSGIIIASNNKENHKNICIQIKKIIQNNNLYPCD